MNRKQCNQAKMAKRAAIATRNRLIMRATDAIIMARDLPDHNEPAIEADTDHQHAKSGMWD